MKSRNAFTQQLKEDKLKFFKGVKKEKIMNYQNSLVVKIMIQKISLQILIIGKT